MERVTPRRLGPSFVSLIGGIANDAKELLLREVALTKLEAQYELRKAKSKAIALGIGIGISILGGICLVLMLVHLLSLTSIPLWGCYGIVGSLLVMVGGVLLVAANTKADEPDAVRLRSVNKIEESA
jgi:Putative Actinobacterial Holin-X, holin superfamily III